MTPEELDAIEARAEAASPGDWMCWSGWGPSRNDGLMRATRLSPKPYALGIAPSDGTGDIAGLREDFEFLAHARTDIPALVAEVRRLWALRCATCKAEDACEAGCKR